VHAHRARLPQPEELLTSDQGPTPRAPREGFQESAWFRINIGRNQNADPRWLLPLLCRRGHVGRGEIGAIRVAAQETLFDVPQAVAGRFLAAVRRTEQQEDDGVIILPVEGSPREEAKRARRDNARPTAHKPRPFRKGGRDCAPGGRPDGQGAPREARPHAGKPGKKGGWSKGPGNKGAGHKGADRQK
jgi:ATP-dependent RNA helicase DeaD